MIGWRDGTYRSRQKPPYAGRTPTTLAYLHQYGIESAYLAPRGINETTGIQKTSIHDDTLLHESNGWRT